MKLSISRANLGVKLTETLLPFTYNPAVVGAWPVQSHRPATCLPVHQSAEYEMEQTKPMRLRFGIGLLGCLLLVACGPVAGENAGNAQPVEVAQLSEEPTLSAVPDTQTPLPTVESSARATATRDEPLVTVPPSTSTESPPAATATTVTDSAGTSVADRYAEYEIVTLLPRDAIPAIDEPEFMDVAEADRFYTPDEFVMGVEFDGDARAYSVGLLSAHEIVNDTVGGVKIAVTW
jgi:hypothetical protein